MKTIKEKLLYVKWARAFNEPIDQAILEEVEQYEVMQKEIAERVVKGALSDLAEATEVKAAEFTKNIKIQEEKIIGYEEGTTFLNRKPITEKKVEQPSFQQPNPPVVDKDLDAIQKKLKFLEQAIGRIAATGPGGGAGDVISLDHYVKTVTSNYTITRKDYYIGVNSPTPTTLTLLDSIGFPGRVIVIKDESGSCSNNPITVVGNVDNDPGGFILQVDNGGIQLIYNNGWRII